MKNKLEIHFLGAAGTVTGSKYLLKTPEKNILVDCGLFQGIKKLRQLNWAYLPVDVKEIDMVLLTHGHLDHCGFLPRLIKMGFRGPVYGTNPTLDIAEIILNDSAKIQEEDSQKANEEGFTKHHPAEPLYTLQDVEKTISHFKMVDLDKDFQISENISVKYRYAGHIIGAAFVELDIFGKRFVFSGDIGRSTDLLMDAPQKPERTDFLFTESTYGERTHSQKDPKIKLKELINETVQKGGSVFIPSFAVERTQTLMLLLWQLKTEGAIPDIKMIMDSPMGANVLRVFHQYSQWHKLDDATCKKMCQSFQIVREYKETLELSADSKPKIVIAGSGMVTGGRILTYLQSGIHKSENTIALVGFQAEGTRGRQLFEGAEEIKFYGNYHKVKARVELIEGLSAHADQHELLEWLSELKTKPQVYITHGEPQASDALRIRIQDRYGFSSVIPDLYQIDTIDLD